MTAPTDPVAPKALCDHPGCGMPATGSLDRLNHCENHAVWAEGKDNKSAAVVRAQRTAEGR